MAFCASSSDPISTNPNPRARPVAMSRMTVTFSTAPARANSSWSSASPVSYGRFPTYSLRLMNQLLHRIRDECAADRQHNCPDNPPRTSVGCRLVAKQNVRRSESGRSRYDLQAAQHAAKSDTAYYHILDVWQPTASKPRAPQSFY